MGTEHMARKRTQRRMYLLKSGEKAIISGRSYCTVSSKKQTFCLRRKVSQLPARKGRVALEVAVVIRPMHNPSIPESAHPTERLNTRAPLACSETYVRTKLTILPDCCQWCRQRGWVCLVVVCCGCTLAWEFIIIYYFSQPC